MNVYIVTIEGAKNPTRIYRSTSGVKNFIYDHRTKPAKVVYANIDIDGADDVTDQFVTSESDIKAPW